MGIWPPKELYISDRIRRFINCCETEELPWAILSAKYGLFFPDEQRQDYDVTFKSDPQRRCRIVKGGYMSDPDQSLAHINNLVATVRRQTNAKKVKDIVFYAPAPRMAKCYFLVMHRAVDGCTKHDVKATVNEIRGCIESSEKIKHITRLI